MLKDLFPVKLLFRPGEAFADIASGRAGWGWPAGLFTLSTLASSALLAWAPADLLAKTAGGLPPPAGGFTFYFFTGLPGGLAFALFSCALLAGFAAALRSGRLMFRVPLPAAAAACYAFFFIARYNSRSGGPLGWAAAAAALGLAAWAALRAPAAYARLVKLFLSLSAFSAAAALSGALALLAGTPQVYTAGEYAFSFLAVIWLIRGAAAVTGLSAPRTFAAAIPALLGSAAFAFSLMTLGLVRPEVFHLLLLM